MESSRLLLIGPRDRSNRFIGGAATSFRAVCAFLADTGLAHVVIDTRSHAGPLQDVRNVLQVLARSFLAIPRSRAVLFFAARRGVTVLAPLLWAWCRVWRRRFCIYPAGGDLMDIYRSQARWRRALLRRAVFGADVLLVQTDPLLDACRPLARNPVRFPNTRGRVTAADRAWSRRFVFMSQVTTAKGAGVLLDALDMLDDSYTVHVFGPVRETELGARLDSRGCYRGVVAPDGVLDVLRSYDVLVLPTFAPEEGHPGVIVEAFSLGMPVIATDWSSVPEVVTHGESGLLVPPRSVQALADAMRSIDDALFAHLRDGARRAFDRFDTGRVLPRILQAVLGDDG